MEIFLILLSVFGEIISVNLQESFGQVIQDQSGFSNYCVLGSTLATDSSDPILTDRGGYFTSSSYLSLPPNSLLPSRYLTLTNFYGILFIKIISPGTIFSIYNSNSVLIELSQSSTNSISIYQYDSLMYTGVRSATLELSIIYVDMWKPVLFSYSFYDISNCYPCGLSVTVDSTSIDIDGAGLTSGSYKARLGSYSGTDGFAGFITIFSLYDGTEYTTAYSVFSLMNGNSAPSGGTDPYTSSTGATCSCGVYSCTGSIVVPACIQCDSSCELYCSTTQTTCLDIVTICQPYAIVNNICDLTINYIDNCSEQTSSTICEECDSGYILSNDKNGCCLSGYYYDSILGCSACDSSCEKCSSGGTDGCTECVDENAEIITTPGTCACKSGFWASSENPIVCSPCFYTCAECSGSTVNDCLDCEDENSNLMNGTCECVDGYYWNSTSLVCEPCFFTCGKCSGPTSSECSECDDENSSLSEGNCNCFDNFYWNTSSLSCELCPSGCLLCVSYTQCSSCKNSFYLDNEFRCSACNDDCEECPSGKCQYCKTGFDLKAGACMRSQLFLTIKVLPFFRILLNFTENLFEPLSSTSLTMNAENDSLNFSVTQDTLKDYSVKIENLKVNKQKIEVFLLFNENLTSEHNSLLLKRDYSCLIIQGIIGKKKVPVYIKAISRSVASTITATAAFSVILNNKIGSVWIFVNTIQVLSYFPLINIDMPDKLSEFLIGVNPLGSLPNPWDSINLFNCNSTNLNPKFSDNGFICEYIIYNTGELLLCFSIGILILLILLFLHKIKFKYFKSTIVAKLGSYKWGYFYRFWIQSSIELVFPAIISLNTLSFDRSDNIINSLLGIIVAIILITSPGFAAFFYWYRRREISENDQEFFKRYSPLFEGFELSTRFKYFFPYFFVWRIVYACVLYNLHYYPSAQIAICCVLQMGSIGFMVKLRVYKEKVDFYMYLLYESIILVVFVVVGLFLTGISDDAKDVLSYFVIGITCAGMLAGIFVSGLESIKKLMKRCREENIDMDIVVEFKNQRSGSLFVKPGKMSGEILCSEKTSQVLPLPYDYLKKHVPSEQNSVNIDESEFFK